MYSREEIEIEIAKFKFSSASEARYMPSMLRQLLTELDQNRRRILALESLLPSDVVFTQTELEHIIEEGKK